MKQKAIAAIEDLKKNRDYSLYWTIYNNNKDRMSNIAIDYRGSKITFKEMFEKADEYAMSLQSMGYKKGSEVLSCVSNSPEFIYLLLAASKIGAKFNTIGEWFEKDYLEMIIRENGTGRIFLSDDNFLPFKDLINNGNLVKEVVMFSLNDSLPKRNGKKYDPFSQIDCKFKSFNNDVENYRKICRRYIVNQDQFINRGLRYCEDTYGFNPNEDRERFRYLLPETKVGLEDDFIITYTSGSTDPGRPKATLHPMKSFAILSRFKESDVSGMPTMKDVRVMSHIPTYVLAGISTSIVDPLYLGCTVIPEPIYDKEYFPYGIVLNKPNMSAGSVGFWRNLCMKLNFDDAWKNTKCKYLYIPIVTGEALGSGEEKFFNMTARKAKFGTDKLPFPLAPVTFSIGGGTNEMTGIFVTLFRALQEKNPLKAIRKIKVGQTPLACADVDIIDKNGDSVQVGEYGEIVARTECGMRGYYYRPDLDEGAKMTRKDGKSWFRMGAFGLKLDKLPHLQIKGRMKDTVMLSSGEEYPLFKIDDLVAKDTKNILSSSVIKVQEGAATEIVIHVEPQPIGATIKTQEELLKSVVNRLDNNIPDELKDSIHFRFRDTSESFPIAPSGKRDTAELTNEGLANTITYREIEYWITTDIKVLKNTKN